MPLTDQIKNYAKKLVEERPDLNQLQSMIRPRKPLAIKFADDGIVPNNPRFPVTIYRAALKLSNKKYDAAVVIDTLFERNGWSRSWRDSVYDFVHYHSRIHEVMGVARGSATLEFGGIKGPKFKVKAGDVVVLPAGTGHRLITSSQNFLVVGAYPAEGTYDECTDTRERVEAAKRIARTPRPGSDPVFGKSGPLLALWRRGKAR